MIRKVCSKLHDSASMGRSMNYALKKAALVGGSEVKFEGTSIKDYVKLGVKKCDQVNNKYEASTGRKQEVKGLHEMISFDASDDVSPEKAAELALNVWRDVLDIDNHRHRWAVHTDTEKIHVHLIWNKRDNGGKVYEQLNDYELFEKALHKTEIENGLKVVEDRKFLKPGMPTNPQPSNEWRYEKKGEKSKKTLFKEAVHSATDKAMTAGEFLEFLDRDGYTLIVNGSQGYSLEKEGTIFKASEIGAAYKSLKARFGDDPLFVDTLARLGVKKAPEREMGGISFDMYVTQADLDQYEAKKKKSNRVLDTQFDSRNGHDFFFKDTNKKAFEYDAVRGRVDFNNNSPTAVKAGLQKLTENVKKPTSFKLGGSDYAKREIWLQFHLMGLDKKGHTLSGYSPTPEDKAKLEKLKLENSAFKKPTEQNNDSGKNSVEAVSDKAKGLGKDLAGAAATALSGGVVNALDVFSTHDPQGSMKDKMSEMRVLDREIKDKNDEAESKRHENKRRNRHIPKPQ